MLGSSVRNLCLCLCQSLGLSILLELELESRFALGLCLELLHLVLELLLLCCMRLLKLDRQSTKVLARERDVVHGRGAVCDQSGRGQGGEHLVTGRHCWGEVRVRVRRGNGW